MGQIDNINSKSDRIGVKYFYNIGYCAICCFDVCLYVVASYIYWHTFCEILACLVGLKQVFEYI